MRVTLFFGIKKYNHTKYLDLLSLEVEVNVYIYISSVLVSFIRVKNNIPKFDTFEIGGSR